MPKSLNKYAILLFLLISTAVLIYVLVIATKSNVTPNTQNQNPIFRLYLSKEPQGLNPALIRGSVANYLFYNLYSSLYRYDNNKIKAYLGNRCVWKSALHLSCKLNAKLKWSNGKSITAKHYLQAYQNLFISSSTKLRFLLNIKNARLILQKTKALSTLGITAKAFSLNFYLSRPDPELLYKLTSPNLAPLYSLKIPKINQAQQLVTNGAYTIKQWIKNQKIILEPNPYFYTNKKRPIIEFYFIEEDSTALVLYQSGRLDFLKRVLTSDILKLKAHKEFFQTAMIKFDYLGFGPQLKAYPNLRKAMVYGLNYVDLKKIYHALGQPGYPSLSLSYFAKPVFYDINLAKAKKALSLVPLQARQNTWTLAYSKAGGEDIKRGMEWLQNQWQKNLGLKIQLRPVEHGVYASVLRSGVFDIFRKGLPLDRPSCLAAMEHFYTKAVNNYIAFSHPDYDQLVKQLQDVTNKTIPVYKKKQLKKHLCSQAMQVLLDNYVLIPMGEIHYSLMMNSKWKGWQLNSLNLLDLSQLHKR